MGGLVAQGIGNALACLREGDSDKGNEVKKGDQIIDLLEVEIEEQCLKVLALYHPVAKDLRAIVTLLKVTTILERMGDLAENIVNKCDYVPPSFISESRMDIPRMGELALAMLDTTMKALIDSDSEMARSVIRLEKEMDQLHKRHHQIIAEDIANPEKAFNKAQLGLLSVSRYLERIGDQAVHVAEDVVYLVDATIIRHNKEVQE